MNEEATPAKQFLRATLQTLGEHTETLRGLPLKDWYVITTHITDDGDEILSRFTRTGQPPWVDTGLLKFALDSDLREWAEDDQGDGTYT